LHLKVANQPLAQVHTEKGLGGVQVFRGLPLRAILRTALLTDAFYGGV